MNSDWFTRIYQSILVEQFCSKIEIWRAILIMSHFSKKTQKYRAAIVRSHFCQPYHLYTIILRRKRRLWQNKHNFLGFWETFPCSTRLVASGHMEKRKRLARDWWSLPDFHRSYGKMVEHHAVQRWQQIEWFSKVECLLREWSIQWLKVPVILRALHVQS